MDAVQVPWRRDVARSSSSSLEVGRSCTASALVACLEEAVEAVQKLGSDESRAASVVVVFLLVLKMPYWTKCQRF